MPKDEEIPKSIDDIKSIQELREWWDSGGLSNDNLVNDVLDDVEVMVDKHFVSMEKYIETQKEFDDFIKLHEEFREKTIPKERIRKAIKELDEEQTKRMIEVSQDYPPIHAELFSNKYETEGFEWLFELFYPRNIIEKKELLNSLLKEVKP